MKCQRSNTTSQKSLEAKVKRSPCFTGEHTRDRLQMSPGLESVESAADFRQE